MIVALLISLLLLLQIPAPAAQVQNESQEDIDIAEIIFDHIGDDYEWHLLTWGDKHIALHLPVIVHASDGWHVFSSKRLSHGRPTKA